MWRQPRAARLQIWRKGEEKSFSLTLGELPKSRDARAGASDSDTTGAGLPKGLFSRRDAVLYV
jgi:hypothetical protein